MLRNTPQGGGGKGGAGVGGKKRVGGVGVGWVEGQAAIYPHKICQMIS